MYISSSLQRRAKMYRIHLHNGTKSNSFSPNSTPAVHSALFKSIFPPFYKFDPVPFCTWVKYCLLVVFHAAMYFSMQLV